MSQKHVIISAGYDGTIRPLLFTPSDAGKPARLELAGKPINGNVGKAPSWISYKTIDLQRTIAYITDESDPGRVFAVSIEVTEGQSSVSLSVRNTDGTDTQGKGAVASAVVDNLLLVANYDSGDLSGYRLEEGGEVQSKPVCLFKFSRSPPDSVGPVSNRQDHSYAHHVEVETLKRWAYVCDLGADKVHQLQIENFTESGEARCTGSTAVQEGAGPRHIAFHHDQEDRNVYGYLACELNTTLVAFVIVPEDGSLRQIGQAQSALPAGVAPGGNPQDGNGRTTSEVAVSPDGRFVYVGTRGDPEEDHIAIFERQTGHGGVRFLEWIASGGRNLRHFSLSAVESGARYISAAHQDTSNVTVLERDVQSGLLRKTGANYPGADKVAFAGFLPRIRQ